MPVNYLSLENFQAIRDRVRIPIRPLTYFFGPNSVGKSAIWDALWMLQDIFLNGGRETSNKWSSWAFRSGRDTTAAPPFIYLSFEGNFALWRSSGGDERLPAALFDAVDECLRRDVNLTVCLTLSTDDLASEAIEKLEVFFDRVRILQIRRVDDDHLGSWSTYMLTLNKDFMVPLQGIVDDMGYDSASDETWQCEVTVDSVARHFRLEVGLYNNVADRSVDNLLVVLATSLLQYIPWTEIRPDSVRPDRGVITDESALYFPDVMLGGGQHGAKIDPAFDAIAKSIERTSMPTPSFFNFEGALRKARGGPPDAEEALPLHDLVNHGLLDLFRDNGYQVVWSAQKLVSFENDEPVGLIVQLSLVDQQGRRFSFSDVGSGVSCVIPVLVGIHSLSTFFQQPELHLHPAMQCSLADVFVERVQDKSVRHILETHSEYMLLRPLRRIRETHTGKLQATNLSLRPSDVAVLYFEPMNDGATRVTEIVVNEYGDFLTPWPRGFFDERASELFDE